MTAAPHEASVEGTLPRSIVDPKGEGRRSILIVTTLREPATELQALVGASDTVKVVAPVVRQGVFDWLANDEEAFGQAQHLAERSAAALPAKTVQAVAGEADVELAIHDALATFAADEVILVVEESDRPLVESVSTESLGAGPRGRVPVRVVVAGSRTLT